MLSIRSSAKLGPRVRLKFSGPGRTKQSMSDECDINSIMRKYRKTGFVSHLAQHGGDYGFASSVDFHGAMDIVAKADQMFDALPAIARRRFGSPGAFLEFVQDEDNFDDMVKMGLANARVPDPEAVKAALDPEPTAVLSAEEIAAAKAAGSEKAV